MKKKLLTIALAVISVTLLAAGLTACKKDPEYTVYAVVEGADDNKKEMELEPFIQGRSENGGYFLIANERGKCGDIRVYNKYVDVSGKYYKGNDELNVNKLAEYIEDGKISVQTYSGEYIDVTVQNPADYFDFYKSFAGDGVTKELKYYRPNYAKDTDKGYYTMTVTGETDGKSIDFYASIYDGGRLIASTGSGSNYNSLGGTVKSVKYLVDGEGYDLTFGNYEAPKLYGICRDGYLDTIMPETGGSEPLTEITVNGRRDGQTFENYNVTDFNFDNDSAGFAQIGGEEFKYYYRYEDVDMLSSGLYTILHQHRSLAQTYKLTGAEANVTYTEDLETYEHAFIYTLKATAHFPAINNAQLNSPENNYELNVRLAFDRNGVYSACSNGFVLEYKYELTQNGSTQLTDYSFNYSKKSPGSAPAVADMETMLGQNGFTVNTGSKTAEFFGYYDYENDGFIDTEPIVFGYQTLEARKDGKFFILSVFDRDVIELFKYYCPALKSVKETDLAAAGLQIVLDSGLEEILEEGSGLPDDVQILETWLMKERLSYAIYTNLCEVGETLVRIPCRTEDGGFVYETLIEGSHVG